MPNKIFLLIEFLVPYAEYRTGEQRHLRDWAARRLVERGIAKLVKEE